MDEATESYTMQLMTITFALKYKKLLLLEELLTGNMLDDSASHCQHCMMSERCA